MDRACRNNRIRPYLCLGLSGLLTSLTLIVPKIGFLEWFSLIPAFLGLWLLQRRETRSGWRYVLGGLSFFLPYYLLSFHWFFYMYPLEFTELSAPAAFLTVLFCWIGLSLIQTAGGCILFYLLGRLGEWLLDRKKLVWLWPVLSGALPSAGL